MSPQNRNIAQPNPLKELFLHRKDIIFLNHGSFGSCPRPVFEEYQRWQLKVEEQPVEVLSVQREMRKNLAWARGILEEYIGAEKNTVVMVPNATFAVNVIARSLCLKAGDEILSNDHEYGACEGTWLHYCKKTGATYVKHPIALPITSKDEILDTLWKRVTDKTKLIFISHITSATALRMPVEEICKKARERGILTFVDGAHAPGQIPLNLSTLGADFYTGNLHKWVCTPKGSAFLYARPDVQNLVEPLIINWGVVNGGISGNRFIDELEWAGTDDPSAYLAVPAAIEFQKVHRWDEVRRWCIKLSAETKGRLEEVVGARPLYPSDEYFSLQMFPVELPGFEPLKTKDTLYDRFGIEIPVHAWNGRTIIRGSVQGYNTKEQYDQLVEAIISIREEML